jgi:hypothetical protein
MAPTTLAANKKYNLESTNLTFSGSQFSAPYWLKQKGSLGMYRVDDTSLIGQPEQVNQFPVTFNMTIAGIPMSFERPIVYKFNDPVKGEVYRPFEVLPAVTTSIPEKVLIFASEDSQNIPVHVRAGRDKITGSVTLQHPKGWVVSPAEHVFSLGRKGEEQTLIFKVTPPKKQSEGYLKPLVSIGDSFYNKELVTIDYDYIPYQSVLLPSEAKVVRLNIQKKGRLIGYIDGAGDAIPESLKQIGYEVATIDPSEINALSLAKYDAIVVGIRAYNTVPDLAFKQTELNRYVENGGTLLIQYNTSHRLVTKDLAPFSLSLSRDRVTDEFSEVQLLAPKHEALNKPNKITQADFENWVQERGLYFPNEWDDTFTPILGMNDKDYPLTKGALLIAEHGKGYYIYTGLSFFRELPAGVPGAYRLFANLLSIGK